MATVHFDPAMTDAERREALYAGDIIILSPTRASSAMVSLAQDMLASAFAPHDPRTIHEYLSAEEVASVLGTLKPRFIHHPDCKRLIPAIMAEHGVDLDSLYFDVPRLRSAYPSDFLSSGIAYAFHPHRDTWYSAPMCQLNWWMPVFPIQAGNAMAFYPQYFDKPVANNSEIYNYYDWNTRSRASAAQHVKSDTREQPKPQQALEGPSLCYLPPPGGIILFAGAQLHETVPNSTGVARYSIDFRTIDLGDAAMNRGAPNVDSRCTGTTMRDYLRASDLSPVPEDVVLLHDDDTARRGQVLRYRPALVEAAAAS